MADHYTVTVINFKLLLQHSITNDVNRVFHIVRKKFRVESKSKFDPFSILLSLSFLIFFAILFS
jgi:hypothetical protein